MTKGKELKVKEKQELDSNAEKLDPSVVFLPSVDIYETEKELVILADLPGVKEEDLNIDLRENTLTIVGDVYYEMSSSGRQLISEYNTGKFYRQFELSELIDDEKIEAVLKDGVLKLLLPKVEKAQPRTIDVKSI